MTATMRHARIIVAALLLVAGHALADPVATGKQTVSNASSLPATARDVDGTSVSRTVKDRFEHLVDHTAGHVNVATYLHAPYVTEPYVAGTTDATAAIQAAASAAVSAGRALRLGGGTFYLTGQVVIDTRAAPAGVFVIDGMGAKITIPSGNTAAFDASTYTDMGNTASTGGVFRVLTPDDDKHHTIIRHLHFSKPTEMTRYSTFINVPTQRNVTIEECGFVGGNPAVLLTRVYGVQVVGCTFDEFERAILLYGASNTAEIQRNRIRNGRWGFKATSNLLGETNVNLRIVGNYFESLTNSGIEFLGVRESYVERNYFEAVDQTGTAYPAIAAALGNTNTHAFIYLGAGEGTSVEGSARNVFVGNYMWSPGAPARSAVYLAGAAFNTFVGNVGGWNVVESTTGLGTTLLDTSGLLKIASLSESWAGAGITFAGRVRSAPGIPISYLGTNATVSYSTAGAETVLASASIPTGTLQQGSRIRVTASGTVSGTAGQKDIRIRLGTTTLGTEIAKTTDAAAETASWEIEAEIAFTGPAVQQYNAVAWKGSTPTRSAQSTLTWNNGASPILVELTGQLVSALDGIALRTIDVQVIQ